MIDINLSTSPPIPKEEMNLVRMKIVNENWEPPTEWLVAAIQTLAQEALETQPRAAPKAAPKSTSLSLDDLI